MLLINMKTFVMYRNNGVMTMGFSFWLPHKYHSIFRRLSELPKYILPIAAVSTVVVNVRVYSPYP